MKHLITLLFALLPLALPAQSTVKYGYVRSDSLLRSLPAYARAQSELADLRRKYEAETAYNEQNFKRLFSEFLQGQKDFPQNILLKRQRDLQEQMERSIAFRHQADSLLRCAEDELLKPLRQQLAAALRAVGLERGYEYIFDLDTGTFPFVHPSVAEDATPYVTEKLRYGDAVPTLLPTPVPQAVPAEPSPSEISPL